MELNELLAKIELLETRQAFQEDTVESLNKVLIQQQQDIEQLQLTINILQERVRQTNDHHPETPVTEPPPPHY